MKSRKTLVVWWSENHTKSKKGMSIVKDIFGNSTSQSVIGIKVNKNTTKLCAFRSDFRK